MFCISQNLILKNSRLWFLFLSNFLKESWNFVEKKKQNTWLNDQLTVYFRNRIWFSKHWIKLVRWWFFTHTLGKFFKNLDVLVLFCRLLVAWLWALFSPLNQILYKWSWYKSSRFFQTRKDKYHIISSICEI